MRGASPIGGIVVSTSPRSGALAAERSRRSRPARDLATLAAFVGIAFAVAAFGSIVTIGTVGGWYARSDRVIWTPPNAVFPIVWTILYALIAVSGWLAWRQRGRAIVGPGLVLFVAQLVVNSLWTPIFFGGYDVIGPPALWVALGVILLLDLLVLGTIASFWQYSRAAALLLLPYLAWILYASTLNWGDAVLNALG